MKRKNRMTPEARKRRNYWVSELAKLSGSFGDDSAKMISELRAEIKSGVRKAGSGFGYLLYISRWT